MLNILKIKQNKKTTVNNKLSTVTYKLNKYSPATKQWVDSIYNYNNANNKLLSYKNNIVNNLLKIYFNFSKIKFKSRRRRNKIKKITSISCKRIYTSTPEIKHTNDKIIFTIYTYNKKRIVLLKRLQKRLKKIFKTRKYKIKMFLKKLLYKIGKVYYLYSKINLFINKTNKRYILNNLRSKRLRDFLIKIKFNKKYFYLKSLKRKFLYRRLKKILYISKLWFVETNKSNTVFLNIKNVGVLGLLKQLYGKNVQIDIINHKSIYFNSDNLSKVIAFKLRDRKASVLRILRKVLFKKLPPRFVFLKDDLQEDLKENVLYNLKYKVINGIRFQVSGRLTKRLTAMRSISKIRYKGGLKNIGSSYRGLSNSLTRNSINRNLQYTKINGKTRNGAFGLKCWVNTG